MPTLIVTTRKGETSTIEARANRSVMEAIVAAGFDELLAICGGSCACGTCHVYVDPAFADRLPPIKDPEEAMLEGSNHRNSTSRLSCQIDVTAALEGMRVTIAPED